MKKTITYLAVASCIALSTGLAQAEPMAHDMGDGRMGQMHAQMADAHFKEMDTNSDGSISKAEFDATHNKYFQDMDANKDGKLTPEEMQAGHMQMQEKRRDQHFDEADANHDGALSRAEVEKMPMLSKRFDKIDTNKDGKLSREEMDAGMQMKHPSRD